MKHLYKDVKQLSAAENFDVARMVKKGDLKARQKMIEGNAGLAYRYALKASRLNKFNLNIIDDDLLSSSMMGLCEAVDRYDPERGWAFSTYAFHWIRKCIGDCVTQSHWNTLKPPKKMIDSYMRFQMEDDEIDAYQNMFISRSYVIDESMADDDVILPDSMTGEDTERDSIADIRRSMHILEPIEHLVISAELGDCDPPHMDAQDYADALASAFTKLQEELR